MSGFSGTIEVYRNTAAKQVADVTGLTLFGEAGPSALRQCGMARNGGERPSVSC